MKFTYNWLRDFVDCKLAPEALAEKLTMAGLEVGAVKPAGSDVVFEVEVTANRPDWLSVVGIAREVAALTDKRLEMESKGRRGEAGNKARRPFVPHPSSVVPRFSIVIEDTKDCPLYIARIIRDVQPGPSPAWLKERLELVGCRSVNNIVDATNYIMFTWGQPLHAFDLDAMQTETICVRRAKTGEKIKTIDGEEKSLTQDMLVIADKNRPVAVAGVMGGEDTEVTERTRNVLLEAAVFNPTLVRRSRQMLGMQSESSYRFERGVDAAFTDFGSGQATALIEQYAKGACVVTKSSSAMPQKKKFIPLDIDRARNTLGLQALSETKVKNILTHLGFGVRLSAKDSFSVEVPAYRPDVSCPEDLIEEVARIIGYEHIPMTLPQVFPQNFSDPRRELVAITKNILVGLGLQEVITYSLVSRSDALGFPGAAAAEPLEVANPLSQEQQVLRSTLVPSLLRVVSHNLNQRQGLVSIFEIADVFSHDGKSSFLEGLSLGFALCGTKPLFTAQGLIRDEQGLLHAKGIIEALLERLGIKGATYTTRDVSAAEVTIRGEKIGMLMEIPDVLLERFDIKNKKVVAAEISLEKVFAHSTGERKFAPLPLYPGILRDVSLVLPEDIPVQDIIADMRNAGGALLEQVEIVDYYKGKQIAEGSRGLTVSCFYRLRERTLTEEEVTPIHSQMLGLLVEKFRAAIR